MSAVSAAKYCSSVPSDPAPLRDSQGSAEPNGFSAAEHAADMCTTLTCSGRCMRSQPQPFRATRGRAAALQMSGAGGMLETEILHIVPGLLASSTQLDVARRILDLEGAQPPSMMESISRLRPQRPPAASSVARYRSHIHGGSAQHNSR